MFCTLLLSLRDRRRKLVPALCTSCRPRVESSHLWTSRSRFYHRRWHEHAPCRCSERSLLARYSSDASVHTTTQLLPIASHAPTYSPGNSTFNHRANENENGSLLSLDGSLKRSSPGKEDKRDQINDVQNFSCLLRNDAFSENVRNSVVVLGKDGGTKSMCSENGRREALGHPDTRPIRNNSRLVFCSYANDRYQLYATTKRLEYGKILHENTLNRMKHNATATLTDKAEGDDLSRPLEIANFSSENTSSHINDTEGSVSSELNDPITSSISEMADSSDSSPTPLMKRDEGNHTNEFHKRVYRYSNLSRCTCPARYYLNYGLRAPITSKTNKPMMKCNKTTKSATPVHLFQVSPASGRKESYEGSSKKEKSGPQIESKKTCWSTRTFKKEVARDENDIASMEIDLETASCSSITSLLPK